MTKSFEPEEFLARVRALTRRQGEVVLDEMKFGDLTVDLDSCDLKCGGKSIHLNFKEFEILKLLMATPGGVITKEDMIVKVWGYDSDASDNNVEAYISFLRKKFAFPKTSVTITTLRKVVTKQGKQVIFVAASKNHDEAISVSRQVDKGVKVVPLSQLEKLVIKRPDRTVVITQTSLIGEKIHQQEIRRIA